ncbi:MAG TPA: ATP-dependent DNA helicase, partial [Noviherbaspirillum sp.]
SEAVQAPLLDKTAVRRIALDHSICPYYLAQDLARWADVIVGDYNYYFDMHALLHALSEAEQWRVGVLVDEAHNLVERARGMYSAELDQHALRALCKSAPAALKKDLERLQRRWSELGRSGVDEESSRYRILPEAPAAFCRALQQALAAIGAFYAEEPAHADAALQSFYLDALHFWSLLESFGDHSLFDLTRSDGTRAGSVIGIRNVMPAPFLARRFAAAATCTLFSATLSPWHFYGDILGLPADTVWVEVESPFDAKQLDVRVARTISTRYADRARSLPAIVELMAQTYAERPGNYLAFFSSFDYLDQACTAFRQRHPEVQVWEQGRRMNEAAREEFLAGFVEGGRGIGFAVLGGAFAEGIDLPGERLVGAFIATLGLPQVNPFNEEVKTRLEAAFGAGYDYTYLFPGLRKVVQAAGRVIRTPEDRGIVVLMDERYAQGKVKRLLPGWWQ